VSQYTRSLGILELRQILVCPSCNALSQKQSKECYCSQLSQQYKRIFYWLMSQVSKLHKISNECPYQHFMQPTERRSTTIRFVQVRQCSQRNKNLSDRSNSSKFIRNTTQNRVDPLEIPFRYDVCGCGVRICWNIVVRVPQKLRVKTHKIRRKHAQCQSSSQIFGVEVR
jgi:hypothetical protein